LAKSEQVDKHLNQANHNYAFLCKVEENLPESFYDWKITVTYYIALHLIRALGEHLGITLPQNHSSIIREIDPEKNGKLTVNRGCHAVFKSLYNASWDARYSGYLSPENRKKYLISRYQKAKKGLEIIKNYVVYRGLPENCLEVE